MNANTIVPLEINEIMNYNTCCLTPMCCEEFCDKTARYYLRYSIRDISFHIVLCKDHAEELYGDELLERYGKREERVEIV